MRVAMMARAVVVSCIFEWCFWLDGCEFEPE